MSYCVKTRIGFIISHASLFFTLITKTDKNNFISGDCKMTKLFNLQANLQILYCEQSASLVLNNILIVNKLFQKPYRLQCSGCQMDASSLALRDKTPSSLYQHYTICRTECQATPLLTVSFFKVWNDSSLRSQIYICYSELISIATKNLLFYTHATLSCSLAEETLEW